MTLDGRLRRLEEEAQRAQAQARPGGGGPGLPAAPLSFWDALSGAGDPAEVQLPPELRRHLEAVLSRPVEDRVEQRLREALQEISSPAEDTLKREGSS